MLLELKGVNGQLQLYEDKVIICRKGVLAKLTQGFTKGNKTIYLRQISGIDFRLGGNFVNGYIQFVMAGGNEKTKGIFEATQDENTIMFRKQDNDIAVQIKSKIEELQQKETNPSARMSAADEIRKYKALLDDGIINEDEFGKKKKELLSI